MCVKARGLPAMAASGCRAPRLVALGRRLGHGLALTHITLGVVHHVIRDCGMARTGHPTVWP